MQNQNIFHIYNKGFLLKFLLSIFIFSFNLNADSLLITKNMARSEWCINDTYIDFNSQSIQFYWLVANDYYILDKANIVEIKTGYKYNSSTKLCDLNTSNPETPTDPIPDENGLIMGMKETDFHLAMALWGVCLSFLMSIGLIISF